MTSRNCICRRTFRWIALLAFLTIGSIGCSRESPSAKKDSASSKPNPEASSKPEQVKALPKQIVDAWEAAGAVLGQVQVSTFGHIDFLPGLPREEDKDEPALLRVPALRLGIAGVGQDGQNPLAKLPVPSSSFGLSLNYPGAGRGWLKGTAGMKSLQALDLGGSKVMDADLKDLAALENLQALDLTATRVTDAGLAELATFKNLQMLHLNELDVTDAGLKKLAALKSLRVLFLSGTKVTDKGLKDLSGMASLNALYLSGPDITDSGLRDLAALKRLQSLILKGTKTTDTGIITALNLAIRLAEGGPFARSSETQPGLFHGQPIPGCLRRLGDAIVDDLLDRALDPARLQCPHRRDSTWAPLTGLVRRKTDRRRAICLRWSSRCTRISDRVQLPLGIRPCWPDSSSMGHVVRVRCNRPGPPVAGVFAAPFHWWIT